jgi:hypothetical protein
MLASSTQSSEAAMSTEVLVGMKKSATDASTAPVRKYGRRRPRRRPGAVAQAPDHRLDEQAGERRGEPEPRDVVALGAEPLVDGRHVGELEPPAELDAQEAEVHVEELRLAQARLRRRNGRHRVGPHGVGAGRGWPAAGHEVVRGCAPL